MASTKINGARISGIASAVPKKVRTLDDDAKIFGKNEVMKISKSTGVKNRHIAFDNMCTSDLCFAASEKLLADIGWVRDSIDGLIFVTQTPDYILPATSCTMHSRLNLSKKCVAFDVNLGCSGYIYGLWIAAQMISSGSLNRVLLMAGDTSSKRISKLDRATYLLFGDAGTVTAIEKGANSDSFNFVLGTDGTGWNNLIVPAGGFRNPRNESTSIPKERESKNIRSEEDLFMDGAEIFTFTLREVAPMIKNLLLDSEWSIDMVDFFVMHQANKFIIEHLSKKMKIPLPKVPISLENYGNTSSASIPITMTHNLSDKLSQDKLHILLSGFGVWYSWGAAAITCGPLVMPDIVIVPQNSNNNYKKGVY